MYFIKIQKIFVTRAWAGVVLLSVYGGYVQASNISTIQSAPKELQHFIQQIVSTHPRFLAAQAERDAMISTYNASDNAIYNPEFEIDSEKTNIRTTTYG